MTSIYTLALADRQQWAMPVDEGDHAVLLELRGAPQPGWRPIEMAILADDGLPCGYSDFPWYNSNTLIVRERAVAAVRDLLGRYGEFLPLAGPDRLELFNVTMVRDVLDEAASSIVRYDDGEIMAIERYAFRVADQGSMGVFKLPHRASDIYVSADVVAGLQERDVHGVAFDLIWRGDRSADQRIEIPALPPSTGRCRSTDG